MLEEAPLSDRIRYGDDPDALVTVAISLFNYESFITEALDSVAAQDLKELSVIVVDDQSTDKSFAVVEAWLREYAPRFATAQLVRHARNLGLASTRNTACALTSSEFVFILDADNTLYPGCVRRCWRSLVGDTTVFAYPILEMFGSAVGLMNTFTWQPWGLRRGNRIDAMGLLRRNAIIRVGGYTKMRVSGWEDYDLWCRFAECGLRGIQVPQVLARYRVHPSSMIRTVESSQASLRQLVEEMRQRHPWLDLN